MTPEEELMSIKKRLDLIELQLTRMPPYANPVGYDLAQNGAEYIECPLCKSSGVIDLSYDDILPGQIYRVDDSGKPIKTCHFCGGIGKYRPGL